VPGLYFGGRNVELDVATPGATIRYTTDDNEPTVSSPVCPSPLAVPETTTIMAKGFRTGSNSSDTLTLSYTIVHKGDVNGDGDVNLADAVAALQIMIGIEPASDVSMGADVNNDNKIGLEEVIYIPQEVSGLRP
jgi:hypothetical protein